MAGFLRNVLGVEVITNAAGTKNIFQVDDNGYQYVTTADSLTAHAGGGQGAALATTATINRFTTVGTAADSAVLPASGAGMQIKVVNAAAANSMNVFPATGEQINALGANAAFALAAGKTVEFSCTTAGQWHSLLSA